MKRLLHLFVFTVFLSLLTVGCSSKNIAKVNVYKMESFSKVEEGSLTKFTGSKSIKNFIKAFDNAKKEPGIVNMVDPDYKVEVGSKSYFLWISEEHGTIMNINDTHTIFTLSKHSAKTINELLN